MSYVKVWIHAVWGTKNHEKLLTKDIRRVLFQHIKVNGKEKNLYIDHVNSYFDHVHCLFTLNADLSLSKTLQLIKGEASFWANKNKLVQPKLAWADDYFAASVSESIVPKVREYIKNQEEHHKTLTFKEEFDRFIEKFNLKHQG